MSQHADVLLLGEDQPADATVLDGLLEKFPEPVLLLNDREQILWSNRKAQTLLRLQDTTGCPCLFSIWSGVEIMGPCFSPINMVLATGKRRQTRIRVNEKTYYDLTVDPFHPQAEAERDDSPANLLLVTLRDTSEETLQQQKLNAIYKAGGDLGDLQPEEVCDLSLHDRIELLKSKLRQHTIELLEFETVEIRILNERTNKLEPLLALGMDTCAEQRELHVSTVGNGVTGFVAATGRSYLCEDTAHDPLYLVGATGARSSLTVPLLRQNKVLGTFNVESFRPNAFTQTDLQYLELFCREVASALNTLDLLKAEKANSVSDSTQRVLCEVADPVDEILNDASWLYEKLGDQDPQVRERLKRVLHGTRDIRELIRTVGSTITSETGSSVTSKTPAYPNLARKRLLVTDTDQAIRHSAHEILERFDVIVETARDGEQALRLARTFHYDVIIADIKPPDMPGSELYRRLRETHEHVPVILMAGFGYDGSHTLVKARQMGLKTVIYKPFIVNQLLKAIEDAVRPRC